MNCLLPNTRLFRQAIDRRKLEEELLVISGREQQRIGQDLHDGLCQQEKAISL
jgi:two-component system sensor kinase FixL